MIAPVLFDVESYFQDNWLGEIHYSNSQKHPSSDEWIYLDVEPVYVAGSMQKCVEESYDIYVTIYAPNKVRSAHLADEVSSFIQGVKIQDGIIGSWRPITQGEVYDGVHFRKIYFPLRGVN